MVYFTELFVWLKVRFCYAYKYELLHSAGLKPVYVFDGKPPTMKSHELVKRKEAREKAQEDLEEAKEAGTAVEVCLSKFYRTSWNCYPRSINKRDDWSKLQKNMLRAAKDF